MSEIRFRIGWFISYLGFHHVLMFFNICAIIFWSFLLASCTSSNGLKNVHLVSLSYKIPAADTTSDPLLLNTNITQGLSEQISNSNKTIQQIRVGYVSICMALNSGIWVCSSNADELARNLKEAGDGDPLNLLRLAETFRRGVLFYALIIIAIIFTFLSILLLTTYPGRHEEVDSEEVDSEEEDSEDSESEIRPFPSRLVSLLVAVLMVSASLLGFVSAFWQHIGAAGASTLVKLLTYDMAEAQLGAAAMTFGWLGVLCACVTASGEIIMLMVSIRLLAALAA